MAYELVTCRAHPCTRKNVRPPDYRKCCAQVRVITFYNTRGNDDATRTQDYAVNVPPNSTSLVDTTFLDE